MTYRYAVDFRVEGDVRFCSHRDMIRLFSRALARAALPVRFSTGFNPHPRFSLIPPRPVGVATEVDRLVLELTEPVAEEALFRRLAAVLPLGMGVRQVRKLEPAEKCVPSRVTYLTPLGPTDRFPLSSRVSEIGGMSVLLVERPPKKGGAMRSVNIASSIQSLKLDDAGLWMTLEYLPEGTAKPAEVLAQLNLGDGIFVTRTSRVKIEWQ